MTQVTFSIPIQSMNLQNPKIFFTVTKGHWRTVAWMGTSVFRNLVTIHRAACSPRLSIYFRPTEQGLIRIALHPRAPGYVGFRLDDKDKSSILRPPSSFPTLTMIQERLRAFESWLPQMKRSSEEEQGVIPWLRDAIDGDLTLPSLGKGWVFLHQEWRWMASTKSDILVIHVPTGRLGIIEFKSHERKLTEAREQVKEYAELWCQQAQELAPFFTKLLQTMGAAYGNEAMCRGVVNMGTPKLFVGTASPQNGVKILDL